MSKLARGAFHKLVCALRPNFNSHYSFSKVGRKTQMYRANSMICAGRPTFMKLAPVLDVGKW